MKSKISGFRDLTVWQRAYELTHNLYRVAMQFSKEEMFGMVSQIRRAVLSVPANIAEGYERNHRKEYLQFLFIAKGSFGELHTYLLLARDIGYFSTADFNQAKATRDATMKMLQGLIKSLS